VLLHGAERVQRKTAAAVNSWFLMQFARECSFRSSLQMLHWRFAKQKFTTKRADMPVGHFQW